MRRAAARPRLPVRDHDAGRTGSAHVVGAVHHRGAAVRGPPPAAAARPVRLVISGVSGTVARGLHVERVEIDHAWCTSPSTGSRAASRCGRSCCRASASAAGSVRSALIEVKRRTTPSTPGPPIFLPRWLIINVDSAHVGSATLTVYNGFRLAATDLQRRGRHPPCTTSASSRPTGSSRTRTSAPSASCARTDPLGMEADGHLDWSPAGQPQWTMAGGARGDLDALTSSRHTVSPVPRRISAARALDLTSHWHWIARCRGTGLRPPAPGESALRCGHISGTLAGSGDEHGFEAHGPLNPAGLARRDVRRAVRRQLRRARAHRAHMQARHRASGARASGSGTIAIVDHGPRLDLPATGMISAGRSPGVTWRCAARRAPSHLPASCPTRCT